MLPSIFSLFPPPSLLPGSVSLFHCKFSLSPLFPPNFSSFSLSPNYPLKRFILPFLLSFSLVPVAPSTLETFGAWAALVALVSLVIKVALGLRRIMNQNQWDYLHQKQKGWLLQHQQSCQNCCHHDFRHHFCSIMLSFLFLVSFYLSLKCHFQTRIYSLSMF